MSLRTLVRIALVLLVCLIPTAASISGASAETGARKQERLAKSSLLKSGLVLIEGLQDPSGGTYLPGSDVDPRATALAVMMMVAMQSEGLEVEMASEVGYLQVTDPVAWADSQFVTFTKGEIAQVVLALIAGGGDPRNVAGNDLVAILANSWQADPGIYGDSFYDTPLVVMALITAGEQVDDGVIETLRDYQHPDGGWSAYGDEPTAQSDTWITAFAIQALVALDLKDDPMVASAVDWLGTMQVEDGSFTTELDFSADAYTTGLVISALIAAGEDLKSGEWADAVTGLLTYRNESGAFHRYHEQPDLEDFTSTVEALIALAGAYWPVIPAS